MRAASCGFEEYFANPPDRASLMTEVKNLHDQQGIEAISKPFLKRAGRRAITGHTIARINEVLDRHTKLTTDQAGAALAKRLAHKGVPAEASQSTVSAFLRR
jgi:hypothetical protein